MCEPGTSHHERKKHTRIVARRIDADPKTALIGVLLEVSFAILRRLMALFSAERTWDLSFMVEPQGVHERAVRRGGCKEEPDP